MERTHRWLQRSLQEHKKLSEKTQGAYQALYGSVQGSVFEDLRVESAQYVASLKTDGIAIGGVSVGESKQEMRRVVSWVLPHLPLDKPKHLLGVGDIDDIFMLVSHGIDTFDCVNPTRIARMGYIYTREPVGVGRQTHVLDISKSIHETSEKPLDAACRCFTCQTYSRGYIHHLFKVRELLGYRLMSLHNLFFIHQLVGDMRKAIVDDQFLELASLWGYNT
jgi:tRNA-guanine transglycosylase